MSCAMALVRFVNTTVESMQRAERALNIAALAAALHLPPQLVDLRHEATHGHLPSLEALTRGIYAALDWLRRELLRVASGAVSSVSRAGVMQ